MQRGIKKMKKIPILFNLKLVNSYFPFQMEGVEAPTNLKALVSGEGSWFSVLLTWNYDKNTPPVKFNIYMKNGSISDTGGYVKTYTIYDKKYVANYITIGKKYSYYVTAVTSKGESQPSNITEVTISEPIVKGTLNETLEKKSVHTPGEQRSAIIKAATSNEGGIGSYNVVAGNLGFFRVKTETGSYNMYSSNKGYGEKTKVKNCN